MISIPCVRTDCGIGVSILGPARIGGLLDQLHIK